MDGARFVVNFAVEGSGEKELDKIAKQFAKIAHVAGSGGGGSGLAAGLGKASGHAADLSGHAGAAGAATAGLAAQAHIAGELFEKVGEAGLGLMHAGMQIFEGWSHVIGTLLHEGMELEQNWVRIQATTKKTGDESRALMTEAVKYTQKLPITEGDSVRILTALSTAHVNAMDAVGDSYAKLHAKGQTLRDLPELIGLDRMAKDGPKAIDVVVDIAAAMGHIGTGYQNRAFHEITEFIETGMKGALRSKALMAWAGDIKKATKGIVDGAGGAEKRLQALFHVLQEKGAVGTAAASMQTLGGVLSNFKGIATLVANAVLEPGKKGGLMNQFVISLQNLYNTIAGYFDEGSTKGAAFMHTLQGIFGFVMGVARTAMEYLGKAIRVVFDFVAEHPDMMKFAAVLSIVAAVAMVVFGAFLVAASAIGAFIALVAAAPAVLLVIPGAIALMIASLGGLAAAFAVGFALWQVWKRDFAGVRTLFDNIGIIFEALQDNFRNGFNDMSDIDYNVAQEMRERGIMGIFLKISNLVRQAKVFFDAFVATFAKRWEEIGPKFEAAFDKIGKVFERVGDAVSAIFGTLFDVTFKAGKEAVEDAADAGADWGEKVAMFVDKIAELALGVADWIDMAIAAAPDLVEGFAEILSTIREVKNGLELLFDVASIVWHGMAVAAMVAYTPMKLIQVAMTALLGAAVNLLAGDISGAFGALTDGADEVKKHFKGIESHIEGVSKGVSSFKGNLKDLEDTEKQRQALLDKAKAMREAGPAAAVGKASMVDKHSQQAALMAQKSEHEHMLASAAYGGMAMSPQEKEAREAQLAAVVNQLMGKEAASEYGSGAGSRESVVQDAQKAIKGSAFAPGVSGGDAYMANAQRMGGVQDAARTQAAVSGATRTVVQEHRIALRGDDEMGKWLAQVVNGAMEKTGGQASSGGGWTSGGGWMPG